MRTGAIFTGVMVRGRGLDHSPPSSAEANNEWRTISLFPLYACMASYGDTFTLTFTEALVIFEEYEDSSVAAHETVLTAGRFKGYFQFFSPFVTNMNSFVSSGFFIVYGLKTHMFFAVQYSYYTRHSSLKLSLNLASFN
jgi:hypothetical protein